MNSYSVRHAPTQAEMQRRTFKGAFADDYQPKLPKKEPKTSKLFKNVFILTVVTALSAVLAYLYVFC